MNRGGEQLPLVFIQAKQPHAPTVYGYEHAENQCDMPIARGAQQHSGQNGSEARQKHGRNQVPNAQPKPGDVQPHPVAVIAVHNEHSRAGGDGCADGCAQNTPFHAQGDAEDNVGQGDDEIYQGAEFVHILSPEDFIAQHLYVGPEGGPEQEQGHGVVHLKFGVAAPKHHKGAAHGHEAPENAAQEDKLQPPHPDKEPIQLPNGPVLRHDAVDPGNEEVGNGRGKGLVIHIELGRHGVDRHGGGAVNPGQQQPVNAPVKIVHHDADENKGGKAHHLPHELEVVVTEGKGHFQLDQAESDVHHTADGGKNQGYHRKGHAAVAQNQQRDHNKGVEDLTAQSHHLLEDILLVDGDMGLKDADGKGQGGVDGHNAQELFPQGDLIHRQLFPKMISPWPARRKPMPSTRVPSTA